MGQGLPKSQPHLAFPPEPASAPVPGVTDRWQPGGQHGQVLAFLEPCPWRKDGPRCSWGGSCVQE